MLCDLDVETMDHIIVGCTFSRITWHEILSWIRSVSRIPTAGDMSVDWWGPIASRKGTSSLIMITAFCLWKHCNVIIFDGAGPDIAGLLDTIKTEAKSWAAAGASGLAALLPIA